MSHEGTGIPACSLHIGTHNVNGALGYRSSSKLAGFVRLWCQHDLAVVCVQETHLTKGLEIRCEQMINGVAERLHHPGWVAWWSHHTGASAGVGILVRKDMVQSGGVQIRKK